MQSPTYINPEIWGKHYWFFLHTMALTYPKYPGTNIQKKYYNFIMDLPHFIPDENMSRYFRELLVEYPVSAYLSDCESLSRWLWFIHNKINIKLEKPTISLEDFYITFYKELSYDKKQAHIFYYNIYKKAIYFIILFGLIIFIYNHL
jgi:hypothetical protein